MKPIIILIEPQMGENIGASARAMLNCGVEDLRLVNPRDGWPNEAANIMSSGALDKMPDVKVYTSTADAIADCHHVYATTARPRDMMKPVMTARQAADDCVERTNKGQKCAYLFGPERAGLNNEDIALSHTIITIPLNPDFSSLNLAQGVLLCAYEWFQSNQIAVAPSPNPLPVGERALFCAKRTPSPPRGEGWGEGAASGPAPHADLNNLYNRLEEELRAGHFFRTQEMQPTVMRNLKNMLARAEMTTQEINTFHGLITALTGKRNK